MKVLVMIELPVLPTGIKQDQILQENSLDSRFNRPGVFVVELTPVVQNLKAFVENVLRDGLVYTEGHWVNPSCVKSIWVVE